MRKFLLDGHVHPCTDGHVHVERGSYIPEWIQAFIDTALSRGIEEIWFVEHCYRFAPFVPMYETIRRENPYFDIWLRRKAGTADLREYICLAEQMRCKKSPVRLRFGLEVCYIPGTEELVYRETKDLPLDFLVGSIHTVGSFAFDHRADLWDGQDVDEIYRTYFRLSLALANSGLFDGMAHPDSIGLFGHRPSFDLLESYDALAAALGKNAMYAEQNSGVHRRCPTTGRLGMDPLLLWCIKNHGVRIVTASDAHSPADVGEGIE